MHVGKNPKFYRIRVAGIGAKDVSDLRETILIRDGLFCGRKFQAQGYSVVWFMEENEIKFFGPTGQLLRATTPEHCVASEPAVQTRRAA